MDYEQDIESDMEEDVVVPKPRTTTTTMTTTSTVIQKTSPGSDILAPASSFHTMDPPSPILPPPPGSISPPRFLSEDFDINDDDLSLLPSSLMSPPKSTTTTTTTTSAGSRSNTVDDDEEEEDDEDAQTIISNKLKAQDDGDAEKASSTSIHGLDTLTSEMAAKLQSMMSEEIEETIPKDPPEDSWACNVINSPPPPVWPQEDSARATSHEEDEEEDDREDESSGNSQSPKQEHKITSLPPPPEPIPTNCVTYDDIVQKIPSPELVRNDEDEDEDDEPTSLPPAPVSSEPSSLDIIPPPQLCSGEIEDEDEEEEVVVRKVTIQSPPPSTRNTQSLETAEERELLQKLQDNNEDEEEEEADEDDLQVPMGICSLSRELKIESAPPPPPIAEEITVVKKQESLDAEMDITKEESDDDDHVQQAPPLEKQPEELPPQLSVVREDSLREEEKLEEESEPEDEPLNFRESLPNIQGMIPKTISIPEKIAPPVQEEIVIPPPKYEPQEIPKYREPIKPVTPPPQKEEKPPEPVQPPKPTTPPPVESKPVAVAAATKKEEDSVELRNKVTSPKGTRLDDFRKPYIPAYQSSLTSSSKPAVGSYTSSLYSSSQQGGSNSSSSGGPVTALNDRNRPVAMVDERRQRYSSPSSSLREQFFSTSSTTSTTMTSSVGVAPQKPPLTQSVGGSSTYSRLESSSSSSTKTETIIQSSSTSQQQSISSSQLQSSQQQQRTQQQQKPEEGRQPQAQSRGSQQQSVESSSRDAKSSTAGKAAATTPGSTTSGGDLERGLVLAAGKDSNGGGNNPGRLPDVSSVVKMTNDVECQSSCSRVVKSGDACSLAFSAIYSKLIIVLGISLPLVEVISPHHIPVLAYQGFYLYLYGVSILFLLFMFFSLCCCSVKPPSSVSPSSSSQSESTSGSSSKKQKKKNGPTTPQTPQEELAQRLELEANQDSNGAGAELNAATSTTNILTTSPAAGGADKKKSSVSYASDDDKDEYHYGSYFLRLAAIVFGVASILYSGLEFGQYFECKHLILTLTPAVRTLFILLQLYFIFLKNEKVTLYPFKLFARVGLMHLIGTNLALWINVLIHETNNEFVDIGPRQNITVWAEEAMSVSFTNWNMSGWNMEWQELMADCPRTNLLGRLIQMVSPYLFPCCIQYALICSVILFFMWRNVGQYPSPSIGVLQQNSSSLCRAVDCRQSYRSVLLGVLILGSTIASVVAFFVLAQTEAKLAITQMMLCELALYGITIVGILIGFLRIRKLQYDGGRGFHLDEYLLIGTQLGLFLYSTLAILGTEFNLECQTIFTWVTALLSILQTVCQTMFILDAGRRKSSTMNQIRKGPGREFVVFLLIANLALWIISIFQKSRPIMNPVPMGFYGLWTWTIITHLFSPLAIFYRIQSVICLTEISKRAYKIKPTFM